MRLPYIPRFFLPKTPLFMPFFSSLFSLLNLNTTTTTFTFSCFLTLISLHFFSFFHTSLTPFLFFSLHFIELLRLTLEIMENVSVLSCKEDEKMDLPPGFRFHPTDEELISHYLYKKVIDSNFSARAIGDVDLNKSEPWDLPCKLYQSSFQTHFFFSLIFICIFIWGLKKFTLFG